MRSLKRVSVIAGGIGLLAAASGTIGIGVSGAHANAVVLHSVCMTSGQQQITATITNNYNLTETATIDQAAVDAGWGPASVPIGKTHGQTIGTGTMTRTAAGNDTSIVTLSVKGTWSDGFTQTTVSDPLLLPGNCRRPPADVVFKEQEGCYGGYFIVPTREGVDYFTSAGDPAILTPVAAGNHFVAVNSTPTIKVVAKDHETGKTLRTWTHTFTPDIPCFHQDTYHLTASTPCGGPVHITGTIGRGGFKTVFAVLDTPATGVPAGPVTTEFTASPGDPISVYFPLPAASRTVPGNDTITVFLLQVNFGDTLQNFKPVLTVQVSPKCAAPAPKPTVHTAVKKQTPVTAPVLASTGAYRPGQAAGLAAVAVAVGAGMCLAAGRRRA